MANPTSVTSASPRLWDQAFNLLDSELRDSLNSTRTRKRDVLEAVLKEVEAKRDLAVRKRWKFKKPNGDVVVVRDVLEKITRWINKFKETGDVIAQYDPAHLALPWAAFRFLLQASVTEIQVFGAVTYDLEIIARIVARYREFERIYLQGTDTSLGSMLEDALTRLYAEVLIHLARAVKLLRERSMVRLLKSPFRMVDEEQMRKILNHEAEVLKIANLTDTNRLSNLEAAVVRLSVQATAYSQPLSEQKCNKILEWLSMSPSRNHHKSISQSRLPGLGEWLPKHSDYVDWQTSSSSSMLLLHGITGSGKSVLCSSIVDSLCSVANSNPSAAPFGYFYCANPEFETGHRTSDNVMRSVLGQLALDFNAECKIKEFLCSEYERQIAWSRIDGFNLPRLKTEDCVRLILELAEQDPLTIIIDSVNSIKDSEQHVLVSALKKIVSEADNVVKIMITSRSNNREPITSAADKHMQVTRHETQQDMQRFVNHMVDTVISEKLLLEGKVSSDLRQMLIQSLSDGAGEMFLWVKLQIERLCRESFEDDVVTALQNKLPEDLDQLYQEAFDSVLKIGTITHNIAKTVFSWILYMRDSLTPPAFLAAVSDERNSALELNQLLAACANLVVLDKETNVICFAHQSVREFLERHDLITSSLAHSLLASACIRACSRGPIATVNLQLPSNDFYVYAAMYWGIHSSLVQQGVAYNDMMDKMTSFIFDEDYDTTLSFDLWTKMKQELVAILPNYHVMKPVLDAIPNDDAQVLFLASVFGLTSLLLIILKHVSNLDVNQKTKYGHTPVYLAAAFGHHATITILFDHGSEVNVEGGRYGSPLHAACLKGHLKAVETLLKLGASTSCGTVFDDALQAACRGGCEDVALYVVENSLVIDTEDAYEKAFEAVARAGFVNVIARLQKPPFHLFNKNSPDKEKKKVRKVIEGGQLGVLRQCLSQQTNRRHIFPADAVALATLHNHKTLVNLLLDEGFDMEAEGIVGTPLRTACRLNCKPIARLLLDRGARIDACGKFGDALQAAAMSGHTTVVRLLLDEGACINQQSGFYGTALQAAAYHGYHSVVSMLLDAGADVHANGYSYDAFHAAAEGGHQNIVMLMLRKGYKFGKPVENFAAFRDPPSPYRALMRAASPGRMSDSFRPRQSSLFPGDTFTKAAKPISELEDIFRAAEGQLESAERNSGEVLSAFEESKSSLRLYGNYPLKAAASAGDTDVVKILLERRAVLYISENVVGSALEAATLNSHLSVIQILLEDASLRQSIKRYIELIFKVGPQGRKSEVIDLALAMASKHCSIDEISELKQKSVNPVQKYHHDLEVAQETLISDYHNSCKVGDIEVVDAILQSRHCEKLRPQDIDSGLRLCILHNRNDVARMLLECALLKARQLPPHKVFIAAAGNGSADIMNLIITHWRDEITKPSSDTISRAMVSSSKNGHIAVVRYLVQKMAANVNGMVPDETARLNLSDRDWEPSKSKSSIFDKSKRMNKRQPKHMTASTITPLQAALQGAAGFDSSSGHGFSTPFFLEDKFKKAKQSQYEEVIIFLIDSGANVNDRGGGNVYPIQLAAKFCSDHVMEKFVSMGANINLTESGESALFAAAGRELSSASVVRRIMANGVTIPEEVERQQQLLEQALRYFKNDTSRKHFSSNTDQTDGCFLVSPSLEYVFNEGSGAVLFAFLLQMPQIATTDVRWTLVLQMAAMLNKVAFVDLLLSRGTDVNAFGYYYGTALQAAARFGHLDMVQKLLDAGAEVNVLEGRWQTALRAALAGGHASVVRVLLNHGADIELRYPKHLLYLYAPETVSENALQLAVRSGDLNIVNNVLEYGVNAIQNEQETIHPLILASEQGHLAIVERLLGAGAPVNVRGIRASHDMSAKHASAIHAAVAGGYSDIIKLLLSYGADVEINVQGSGTPLNLATRKNRVDIVHLLRSAGAVAAGEVEFVQRRRNKKR